MDNDINNELQEFSLDDILNEFHDAPNENPEDVEDVEMDPELEALLHLPQVEIPTISVEEEVSAASSEAGSDEADGTPQEAEAAGDTIRFTLASEEVSEAPAEETAAEAAEAETAANAETTRIDVLSGETGYDSAANEEGEDPSAAEEVAPPPPIVFNPRARLKELKKKLIAGPEKRYYDLSEFGVGKLQIGILLNVLIVVLCAGATTLFAMGMVPENRLRLVIFSQVLAMLLSALLGCYQMIDGIGELFKGRFTVNTLMTFTFLVCCTDAVFCLKELRVPCCAAFSLEMTMALWARYQRRSTEMAQMDTLRKAVRLNSLVKVPDYYEGRPGILRGEGQVEDFMDNYAASSGPEKVQNVYALISLFVCIGIAAFAGVRHGVSLAVQILSTSLLVAVPASFFVSLTRPAAVLERRLHMVGTVLCGWQGVKKLCGKAAFPLRDEDLFPAGSTKLNGVKFYGDRNPDEVVSYTTSLICAAGGGLVPVFRQLLASRNGVEHPVENFQNYGNGGIGGEVCGEPVLLGCLNFLQDMGVEIPEGTMVNQAVYAAIDGQLCAVIAISYAKMRSAAAGMVTLCGYRKITPVLIGGDFMLTESFLRGKFLVSTRRIAFPSREDRAALAQRESEADTPALALITREDLVSSAYAVTGAKALRTASVLGVAIHLLGGILGMLIMLALAYLGTAELLTPTHVLLYQLVWMIPGLLVTEWTRTV